MILLTQVLKLFPLGNIDCVIHVFPVGGSQGKLIRFFIEMMLI